ncbi:MAG TPA: HlyD family type I secretion periplasmic adaptor subunit [Pirellulaceae bacterium]|nr:HlyD family type I secretion periplasmic adaptor subunit [Pirellulaceae bacterium]HMO91899.1 HlyD family type I secretion periplasmic adaptor subunit [Pirellulaceae bacterium]HMP68699.1 HlyD family type I secretion periplasmic adaptor subunit [Pirellulaceae bacterium]
MVSTNGSRVGEQDNLKSNGNRVDVEAPSVSAGASQSPGDQVGDTEPIETDAEQQTSPSTAVAVVRPTRKVPRTKRLAGIERTVMEFQPDVVELELRKVPGGARWTLYTVILLIIAAVTWAWMAKVDRIVECQGELIPSEEPIMIFASDQLKIVQLHARFNDRVKAGDVLVTLDPTFSQADADRIRTRLLGLQIRIGRLRAELDNLESTEVTEFDFDLSQFGQDIEFAQKALFEEQLTYSSRNAEYRSECNRRLAERGGIETQLKSNAKAIEARKKITEMQKKSADTEKDLVEKGASSPRNLQDLMARYLSSQYELDVEMNRTKELDAQLDVIDAELAAYKAKWRSELSQLLSESLQQLEEARNESIKATHARSLAEIRVPTNTEFGDKAEFIVLERTDLTVGSTASPNQPIYRLMPASARLELEVKIDGKDIARLKADQSPNPLTEEAMGDLVRIKLAALPFQKHGTLEGRLKAISEGTFSEGQGPTQQVFYRGRVRLVTVEPKEVHADFRLLPGMACSAEIKVGTRRVIDYFLYPLFRSLDSAIREP